MTCSLNRRIYGRQLSPILTVWPIKYGWVFCQISLMFICLDNDEKTESMKNPHQRILSILLYMFSSLTCLLVFSHPFPYTCWYLSLVCFSSSKSCTRKRNKEYTNIFLLDPIFYHSFALSHHKIIFFKNCLLQARQ